MRIIYLLNTYPVPSGTFIRNEIDAVSQYHIEIIRFASRSFSGPLIDDRDISENSRTNYLLEGNFFGLFLSNIFELMTNIRGLFRTFPAILRFIRGDPRNWFRHIAYLLQAAALKQAAHKAGATHVHTHFGSNATSVALLCHLMGGPSYSFTAHGPDEFLHPERQSFDIKISNSKFVVAISEYCRKKLIELSGDQSASHKIFTIKCGINIREFDTSEPIASDNQALVCIGRLCPQKGQIHLPQIVAGLRDQFPLLRITLVGDGESRAEIEEQIALHDVQDEITLVGWATNKQVRDHLSRSRALILPSYAEGLPIVIMEAFMMERPVITTTIAGIPELVDASCGWLSEPGNTSQLATAIASALKLSPEEVQAMGHEGRTRVERLHDRVHQGMKLADLFKTPSANLSK
jgi:glycosyltransferase involved in cell wall biosynthesis